MLFEPSSPGRVRRLRAMPPPPSSAPTLAEVFRAEEGALVRFATGLCGRREWAEEIVQEAFLKLHSQWSEVENPRAWLFRCVRNLSSNRRRDEAREILPGELPETRDESPLPDETLSRLEACGFLRMLVAELPRDDRELLRLKFDERLGYAEIGRRTGLSVGNVGFRLHHLLKTLASRMRAAGIENGGPTP